MELGRFFVLNIFLTFIDATVGYHAAPALSRLAGVRRDGTESAVRSVRALLTGVVALYMFFNCLAFFDGTTWLMYAVSAVLAVDIAAQLVILSRVSSREKD